MLMKNEDNRVYTNRKLDPIWEEPYRIVKSNGNGSYKLQDCKGKILAKMWNDVNIKKFYP